MKTVFFDRSRKSGRWVTVVRDGAQATLTEHPNELTARAFIGLQGGSQDSDYRPPADATGGETIPDGPS